MFANNPLLTTVEINFPTIGFNIKDVSHMFENSGITDDIVLSGNLYGIIKINKLCSSYTKILGLPPNLTYLEDTNYSTALNNATSLEYLFWDNIGIKDYQTAFDFTANTKLGTGSTENLQAFKNLFINAFDRKTAGYAVCTVSLADTQKALLTAEEITAFENKGYKIA